MLELRRLAAPALAAAGLAGEQSQLERRKRDLHEAFVVELVRDGRDVRHQLMSRRAALREARLGISARQEAARRGVELLTVPTK